MNKEPGRKRHRRKAGAATRPTSINPEPYRLQNPRETSRESSDAGSADSFPVGKIIPIVAGGVAMQLLDQFAVCFPCPCLDFSTGEDIKRIARNYAAAAASHFRVEAGWPVRAAADSSTEVLESKLKNACVLIQLAAPGH